MANINQLTQLQKLILIAFLDVTCKDFKINFKNTDSNNIKDNNCKKIALFIVRLFFHIEKQKIALIKTPSYFYITIISFQRNNLFFK